MTIKADFSHEVRKVVRSGGLRRGEDPGGDLMR